MRSELQARQAAAEKMKVEDKSLSLVSNKDVDHCFQTKEKSFSFRKAAVVERDENQAEKVMRHTTANHKPPCDALL